MSGCPVANVFIGAQPPVAAPTEGKFEPKMSPHILVGVGIGPGGVWDKTYGVIKLTRMIGEKRTSRACIRHTGDVMFPEIPSFPIRQKLNIFGAICDDNLPGPAVSDSSEAWGITEALDDGSDEDQFDGSLGENRPCLQNDLIHLCCKYFTLI